MATQWINTGMKNSHSLNKQPIRKRRKNSKLHHSPWLNGPAESNIKMLKWNNNPTELKRACASLLKFWTSIQRNTRLLFRKWFFVTFQWVVKSITSGLTVPEDGAFPGRRVTPLRVVKKEGWAFCTRHHYSLKKVIFMLNHLHKTIWLEENRLLANIEHLQRALAWHQMPADLFAIWIDVFFSLGSWKEIVIWGNNSTWKDRTECLKLEIFPSILHVFLCRPESWS